MGNPERIQERASLLFRREENSLDGYRYFVLTLVTAHAAEIQAEGWNDVHSGDALTRYQE